MLQAARPEELFSLTAGSQKRDFTYVEDVGEGLLPLGLAAMKPGEIINLATVTLTSVRCFAQQAAEILHIFTDQLSFESVSTRDEAMYHSEVSLVRLKEIIGWGLPTKIHEGIQKNPRLLKISILATDI